MQDPGSSRSCSQAAVGEIPKNSQQYADSIRRYIVYVIINGRVNTKEVIIIRNKLCQFHDYNLDVFKQTKTYPWCPNIEDLLEIYIDLEIRYAYTKEALVEKHDYILEQEDFCAKKILFNLFAFFKGHLNFVKNTSLTADEERKLYIAIYKFLLPLPYKDYPLYHKVGAELEQKIGIDAILKRLIDSPITHHFHKDCNSDILELHDLLSGPDNFIPEESFQFLPINASPFGTLDELSQLVPSNPLPDTANASKNEKALDDFGWDNDEFSNINFIKVEESKDESSDDKTPPSEGSTNSSLSNFDLFTTSTSSAGSSGRGDFSSQGSGSFLGSINVCALNKNKPPKVEDDKLDRRKTLETYIEDVAKTSKKVKELIKNAQSQVETWPLNETCLENNISFSMEPETASISVVNAFQATSDCECSVAHWKDLLSPYWGKEKDTEIIVKNDIIIKQLKPLPPFVPVVQETEKFAHFAALELLANTSLELSSDTSEILDSPKKPNNGDKVTVERLDTPLFIPNDFTSFNINYEAPSDKVVYSDSYASNPENSNDSAASNSNEDEKLILEEPLNLCLPTKRSKNMAERKAYAGDKLNSERQSNSVITAKSPIRKDIIEKLSRRVEEKVGNGKKLIDCFMSETVSANIDAAINNVVNSYTKPNRGRRKSVKANSAKIKIKLKDGNKRGRVNETLELSVAENDVNEIVIESKTKAITSKVGRRKPKGRFARKVKKSFKIDKISEDAPPSVEIDSLPSIAIEEFVNKKLKETEKEKISTNVKQTKPRTRKRSGEKASEIDMSLSHQKMVEVKNNSSLPIVNEEHDENVKNTTKIVVKARRRKSKNSVSEGNPEPEKESTNNGKKDKTSTTVVVPSILEDIVAIKSSKEKLKDTDKPKSKRKTKNKAEMEEAKQEPNQASLDSMLPSNELNKVLDSKEEIIQTKRKKRRTRSTALEEAESEKLKLNEDLLNSMSNEKSVEVPKEKTNKRQQNRSKSKSTTRKDQLNKIVEDNEVKNILVTENTVEKPNDATLTQVEAETADEQTIRKIMDKRRGRSISSHLEVTKEPIAQVDTKKIDLESPTVEKIPLIISENAEKEINFEETTQIANIIRKRRGSQFREQKSVNETIKIDSDKNNSDQNESLIDNCTTVSEIPNTIAAEKDTNASVGFDHLEANEKDIDDSSKVCDISSEQSDQNVQQLSGEDHDLLIDEIAFETEIPFDKHEIESAISLNTEDEQIEEILENSETSINLKNVEDPHDTDKSCPDEIAIISKPEYTIDIKLDSDINKISNKNCKRKTVAKIIPIRRLSQKECSDHEDLEPSPLTVQNKEGDNEKPDEQHDLDTVEDVVSSGSDTTIDDKCLSKRKMDENDQHEDIPSKKSRLENDYIPQPVFDVQGYFEDINAPFVCVDPNKVIQADDSSSDLTQSTNSPIYSTSSPSITTTSTTSTLPPFEDAVSNVLQPIVDDQMLPNFANDNINKVLRNVEEVFDQFVGSSHEKKYIPSEHIVSVEKLNTDQLETNCEEESLEKSNQMAIKHILEIQVNQIDSNAPEGPTIDVSDLKYVNNDSNYVDESIFDEELSNQMKSQTKRDLTDQPLFEDDQPDLPSLENLLLNNVLSIDTLPPPNSATENDMNLYVEDNVKMPEKVVSPISNNTKSKNNLPHAQTTRIKDDDPTQFVQRKPSFNRTVTVYASKPKISVRKGLEEKDKSVSDTAASQTEKTDLVINKLELPLSNSVNVKPRNNVKPVKDPIQEKHSIDNILKNSSHDIEVKQSTAKIMDSMSSSKKSSTANKNASAEGLEMKQTKGKIIDSESNSKWPTTINKYASVEGIEVKQTTDKVTDSVSNSRKSTANKNASGKGLEMKLRKDKIIDSGSNSKIPTTTNKNAYVEGIDVKQTTDKVVDSASNSKIPTTANKNAYMGSTRTEKIVNSVSSSTNNKNSHLEVNKRKNGCSDPSLGKTCYPITSPMKDRKGHDRRASDNQNLQHQPDKIKRELQEEDMKRYKENKTIHDVRPGNSDFLKRKLKELDKDHAQPKTEKCIKTESGRRSSTNHYPPNNKTEHLNGHIPRTSYSHDLRHPQPYGTDSNNSRFGGSSRSSDGYLSTYVPTCTTNGESNSNFEPNRVSYSYLTYIRKKNQQIENSRQSTSAPRLSSRSHTDSHDNHRGDSGYGDSAYSTNSRSSRNGYAEADFENFRQSSSTSDSYFHPDKLAAIVKRNRGKAPTSDSNNEFWGDKLTSFLSSDSHLEESIKKVRKKL